MGKLLFIVLVVVVLTFYLTVSVPYCIPPSLSNISGDGSTKIQTTEEIADIMASKLILLNVRGESMFPTIKDNSRCLCVKTEDYTPGDIIAFVISNGQRISHRIIYFDKETVITKGDNNDFMDPPTRKENIICEIPEVPRYITMISGIKG